MQKLFTVDLICDAKEKRKFVTYEYTYAFASVDLEFRRRSIVVLASRMNWTAGTVDLKISGTHTNRMYV